jgi:acetyltransferase-like isoleucine patch superfamily enzyme
MSPDARRPSLFDLAGPADRGGAGVLEILKALWWDLKTARCRLRFLLAFLRDIPGDVGKAARARLLARHFASCGDDVIIHEGARFRNIHKIHVADGAEIGVDNFLQGGGGITIGRNAMLGPGVKVWSANHRFDDLDTPIRDQGYDFASVTIADGCWLGANVIVLPGVDLAEGCVVSAGSVVGVKRYPPYSIMAGNPARVIGNRRPAAADPAAADQAGPAGSPDTTA